MTTVREFAEKVLFAESLADKLAPPPAAGLEDVGRGGAIEAPERPGRPGELRLQADGVRVDFPGVAQIESDEERGRLLHFFANHELLATELMALVLLKFPDAPADFRAGVLKTLKEEQMHTKLYMRRMEACGVAFGDLPVNGFFWNLVAPMPTPLDYVTRLSLTFEQANLDYSKAYAEVFARSGDRETAGILERIYQDEISHVHYGLEWFRKWRKGDSDWKSFCSLLDMPLSPARAKGTVAFNEAGRHEAGLDAEFIRELKVFARSRGRKPDVHWFNPGAEEELAGKGMRKAMSQIETDLELLMAFVARPDDVVLVKRPPSTEHRLSLAAAGIELPEILAWDDQAELRERKLGQACPWAATPREAETARKIGLELTTTSAPLFSKAEHTKFLHGLLDAGGWDLLADETVVGRRVWSAHEADEWMNASPHGDWVLKAPVSTAGRDRHRFSSLEEADGEWFERGWVLEPWLDRVMDFSIQYDRRKSGELARRGMAVLDNRRGGQFRCARATRRVVSSLPVEFRRQLFLNDARRGDLAVWLEEYFEPQLNDWLAAFDFVGPVGIDAMFYRDLSGQLRFKPVVEVNPRVTMGRVAVELGRFQKRGDESVLLIQPLDQPWPEPSVRLTESGEETRFAAYWLTCSGK